MKTKRIIGICAILALIISALCILCSCGPDDPDTPNNNEIIYVIKDGISEYSIVYSEGGDGECSHFAQASIIFNAMMSNYNYNDNYNNDVPPRYEYVEKKAEGKEFLFGATDRQLSKDLMAAVDAKGEGVWYAYGVKDGNIGYYANSEAAIGLSWKDFYNLICKENTIEVKGDLWVVGGMTKAEYEAYLKDLQDKADADAEAKRQQKIADLKASIAALKPSLMGTISTSGYYKSGTENPTYGTTTITPDKLYDHPRVWVNPTNLAQVIANLQVAENKTAYDKIKATADLDYTGKLGDLISSGSAAGNRNFKSTSDLAKIEALAFVYLTTEDELYGYAAINATKNFLNTVKVRPNKLSWDGDQIYDISNQCATAMGIFAEVYDWCYDLLSKEDKDYIVSGCINKLAPTFEVSNPPANTGAVSGHSTGALTLRDWLSFAIAVADEYEYIYNHMMALVEYYYAPAPNWYYPSGANFQGSAYGVNKTYLHMISEMAVKIATGEKIYADDVSFEATAYTYIHYLRPDGESLRIGDDYSQNYNGPYSVDVRMAVWGSLYYNDPKLKSWAMALTNGFSTIGYNQARLETTPSKILLLNDPTLNYDVNTRYEMPLVNFTGAPLSSLIARSAWGDENAWMTFTNVQEAYGANHDHKDAGTFQIYYKGILAPDTGAYQYDGQSYGVAYDTNYVKQTVSKNGLLIYNPSKASSGYVGGQRTERGENATLDAWLSKPTASQSVSLGRASALDNNDELIYAYISSDITGAYDSDTVDLVMRSTMSIATGDAAHPLMFIVYDRITSDDASFEKSFVLHTTNKPVFGTGSTDVAITETASGSKNWNGFNQVSGTNTFYYDNTLGPIGDYASDKADDKYNGQLTATTLLPQEPNYYYVGGEGKHFWLNGANAGNESNSEEYPVVELGWGRVEIVPSEPSKTDSFLNVMYVSDAGDKTYKPATLVQGNKHEGAVSFGNCVMFSMNNELIAEPVSFTTAGTDKLDYYVTGLQAGNWEIKVNGTVVETVTVNKGEHIATFNAAAGEVTVTPAFAAIDYVLNGGTAVTELPMTYTYGTAISLPTDLTRLGATFEGWYTTPDFQSGTKVTEISATQTGEVKLYANWTKLFDVLMFELNGGSMEHDTIMPIPTTPYKLPIPVKEESLFDGWYANPDFEGAKFTSISSSGDNVTLYAKFISLVGYVEHRSSYNESGQVNGETYLNYEEIISSAQNKCLTMLFIPDSTDLKSERSGHIRVRTNEGQLGVFPIFLENNDIKDCNQKTIATYEAGDYVEIVLDFSTHQLRYYVNGEFACFADVQFSTDLSDYDFRQASTFKYIWQYNNQLNKDTDFDVYIFSGDPYYGYMPDQD